jgi:hypothetical protein
MRSRSLLAAAVMAAFASLVVGQSVAAATTNPGPAKPTREVQAGSSFVSLPDGRPMGDAGAYAVGGALLLAGAVALGSKRR